MIKKPLPIELLPLVDALEEVGAPETNTEDATLDVFDIREVTDTPDSITFGNALATLQAQISDGDFSSAFDAIDNFEGGYWETLMGVLDDAAVKILTDDVTV